METLNSLCKMFQGDKGDRGQRGRRGKTGPPGPMGPSGTIGETGVPGWQVSFTNEIQLPFYCFGFSWFNLID